VDRAKINTSNRSLGTNRRLDSACCVVYITSFRWWIQLEEEEITSFQPHQAD